MVDNSEGQYEPIRKNDEDNQYEPIKKNDEDNQYEPLEFGGGGASQEGAYQPLSFQRDRGHQHLRNYPNHHHPYMN